MNRSRIHGLMWVLVVPLVLAGLALHVWLVMLGIGVLHSIFPGIPALGFPTSALVALALALIFPRSSS